MLTQNKQVGTVRRKTVIVTHLQARNIKRKTYWINVRKLHSFVIYEIYFVLVDQIMMATDKFP